MLGMVAKLAKAIARGAWIFCGKLDRAVAARSLANVSRQAILGPHDSSRIKPLGLRLETPSLHAGSGSRAREKNDVSATESGDCREIASCWWKTRPICCCFLLCAPTGVHAAKRDAY